MALLVIIPFILFKIAISLVVYAAGLTFTGLTVFLVYHLHSNLKNIANLKKRAISDLRFVASIGFIATFISIPAYHTATFLLTDAVSLFSAYDFINFVTTVQTAIYIIDAILKLICLFYAIKAIVYATRMIKVAAPENPEVSKGTFQISADNRCPTCNAQLVNGAEFCTRCGSRTDRDNS